MSDFAVLLVGESEQPTIVRLRADPGGLALTGVNGPVASVPWWRLYRIDEDRSTHRFRRLDRRNWELRVMTGADQQLLAHIGRRPLHRLIHPLRRLEILKVVAGVLVLVVTIAQHAPPESLARTIPSWAQQRLVDGIIAEQAPLRCSHQGGEAAVRKLLVRLDPDLGRKVDIVAIRQGGFIVTATPGQHIFMYRSSMAEVDAAALPAMLAHQLSHLRHHDAITAVLRRNGFLGTWAALLKGGGRETLQMEFSGLEERRADLEAMQMMKRARMPLKPAVDMFEQMRVSKEQGGFYGFDQRDFHFGVDARAQRWARAASSDPPAERAALTPDQEDALFNFCWSGPIPPLPKGALRAPPTTATAAPALWEIGLTEKASRPNRKGHLTFRRALSKASLSTNQGCLT